MKEGKLDSRHGTWILIDKRKKAKSMKEQARSAEEMKLYNEQYKELYKAVKVAVKIKMNGSNKKVKKHRMLHAEMILKLSTVLLGI